MENTTPTQPMTLEEYTGQRGDIAIDAVNNMHLLLCRASANKQITRDEMLDTLADIWKKYESRMDDLYVKATSGTSAI
jgi:hypothetical protein